ncbi:hypothetical protein JTB14_029213 [Gonioctena quinquepunctata]|nr:hypothetical protein JTB14_029213 [Gonioctena quinquepunctata]
MVSRFRSLGLGIVVADLQHCALRGKTFMTNMAEVQPLIEKELADIWENWSDSEDGLDFSDTDSVADPNYTQEISDALVNQDEDILSSNGSDEKVEPEDENKPSE